MIAAENIFIDVGSTNVKYKQSGGALKSVPFPAPCKNDGVFFEVSVKEIIETVKNIIDASPAAAVWLSVQMHGYILSDENHVPVTEYISWRDRRFTALGCGYPFGLKSDSGVSAKNNLPAYSVFAEKTLFPEIWRRARYFDTLGSYIVFSLTGKSKLHITDACPTGFYLRTGEIDTDISDREEFEKISFPPAVQDAEAAGVYRGKRVMTAVGDQQAGVFGAAGDQDAYIFNTGTAVQVCCIGDISADGDFEKRPFFGSKTLCTVTGLTGGAELSDEKNRKEAEENYICAIRKLPLKHKIYAVGGAALYHREIFEKVGKACKMKCEFKKGGAIQGLEKLARPSESGIMVSEIQFPNMPILLKNGGLDFFIIDCEHGAFDYAAVGALVMTAKLAGIKCIIRIPDNARKDIVKYMDMGADGLLLCMTDNAAAIKKVVEYAKYAPFGRRGLSTMRAHTLYNPPEIVEYMENANNRTEIYAQIETRAGVENVCEILREEGVAGCFVGPNDLSCDYGCLENKNAPEILSAVSQIAEAAEKYGKKSGIISGNEHYLKCARESGMHLFCIGSELNMILSGSRAVKDKVSKL